MKHAKQLDLHETIRADKSYTHIFTRLHPFTTDSSQGITPAREDTGVDMSV